MKAIISSFLGKGFVVRIVFCLLIIAHFTLLTALLVVKEGFAAEQKRQVITERAGIVRSIVPTFSSILFSGVFNKETVVKETVLIDQNTESEMAAVISSSNVANASAASAVTPPSGRTAFDFDGDGKTDYAVWTPATGIWQVLKSSNGSTVSQQWGASGDRIVPADYDGDGKTDYAVWTPVSGMWNILESSTSQTYTLQWGASTDIPMPADYDGDGKADVAVWRPSNGTWYIVKRPQNTWYNMQFGDASAGDIPAAGDYDGDGKADIAVWRASNGYWYIFQSSTNTVIWQQWGQTGDIPLPADYDGDAKNDYPILRPSTSSPAGASDWYILKSTGGYIYALFGASSPADMLVPADYDGDGKADVAVWRPSNGTWYVWRSSDSGYSYQQFGSSCDVPIPMAFVNQATGTCNVTPTPTPAPSQATINRARLSPRNSTGATNLYSQNFGWGSGLVGLPGRAGLDAGLSLSYNSLVWTKASGTMVFDADNANISPGFRFGFPVIEPVYTDSLTNKLTYLMITSSGGRVELRQTAANSNIYESADSNYLQLEVVAGTNGQQLILHSTDGTQLKYDWKLNAYHCSQIKDSNGNYITINHDQNGLLQSLTDTLGRVISVNYDSQQYPISITQNWQLGNGTGGSYTHTYATFTYTNITINTNFTGVGVSGPPNGTVLKVLQKITSATGSATTFEYNSYGQVSKINNYAEDQHLLNSVRTDLQNASSGTQTDCPRFTETRSYAEGFNNNAETVVSNTYTENLSYNVGSLSGTTGTKVTVSMTDAPHGITSTMWYHGAGSWKEGLPLATEDFGDGVRRRWTTTAWTQDNINLAYILNPRVTQSKVGDVSNIKRTDINYLTTGSLANFGLVKEVMIYDDNTNTLQKKSAISYKEDAAYLSKRIIGLPAQSELYDKLSILTAKASYGYDETAFNNLDNLQQTITPVQHDNTNFGASFLVGRGNLTSTTRWSVDSNDPVQSVTSQVRYDVAGSPVAQIDPLNRMVKINYTDQFHDDLNNTLGRNTFAYPTTLTDPAGYSSQVRYRYDIGANVWAKSPAPAGNQDGKKTTRIFNTLGRLERQSIWKGTVEHAYTRYEYPTNGIQSKVYSTVTAGAGEVLAESWTDGAGRVVKSRTEELPNSLGWSGTKTEYDVLGRVTRSSVPTEVNSNWNTASGNDYRGVDGNGSPIFLWNAQEYDWKGRVTRTIPSDSTGADGKDQLISYDGCGCAGGQVTTIQSESVPRDDLPNTNARRTQKIYADLLGRTWKTEILNWNNSVYSTTITQFNGRDQATSVTQTEASTSKIQIATLGYDGHGRLKTQQLPQQTSATIYNYNADDSIQTVVDARGASANYTYNDGRGLLTGIVYQVPSGSTIPTAPSVSFIYDNIGNRTQMTDGLGTVSYQYNQLSQMTAETRQFSDSLPGAPLPNSSYKIQYDYDLSGQLTSLTEPFGVVVNYNHDKLGRLTSVTLPTAYGGTSTLAANAQYRAFGGLKHLEYGNGVQMNQTFNAKLQAENYQLGNSTQAVMNKTYDYYADGSLRYVQDNLNPKFDRLNSYDQVGRIKEAKSSAEARGQTIPAYDYGSQLPYRQSYQFNAFGDMIQRNNLHWGGEKNSQYDMTNHRITSPYSGSPWEYDADGRVTVSGSPEPISELTYDAAGRLIKKHDITAIQISEDEVLRFYDGDGREGKREESVCSTTDPNQFCQWMSEATIYYIRSTVLGGAVISEAGAINGATNNGGQNKSYVLAGGTLLASLTKRHYFPTNTTYDTVIYNHTEAAGMSIRSTYTAPFQMTAYGAEYDTSAGELDAGATNVGLVSPYAPPQPEQPPEPIIPLEDISPLYIDGQRRTCELDGMAISCSQISNNSAAQCPNNNCGAQVFTNSRGQRVVSSGFQAYSDGTSGYRLPVWGSRTVNLEGESRPHGTPEILGWENIQVSSSSNWNLTRQTRQYEVLPTDLRGAVERRLDKDDCRQFLNDILAKLGVKNKTIDSLFTDVEAIGGPELVKNLTDFGKPVDGISHYGKKATIGVNAYPKRADSVQSNQIVHKYITTILHELIHRGSGKEGHQDLARAAFSILSVGNKDIEKLPTKQDAKSQGVSLDSAFSKYLDRRINDKCTYDPNVKP